MKQVTAVFYLCLASEQQYIHLLPINICQQQNKMISRIFTRYIKIFIEVVSFSIFCKFICRSWQFMKIQTIHHCLAKILNTGKQILQTSAKGEDKSNSKRF